MTDIVPLTTAAAVYCIREQLHKDAQGGTPEQDAALIEMLESGAMRAGLTPDGTLALTPVRPGVANPFAGATYIGPDELRRRMQGRGS